MNRGEEILEIRKRAEFPNIDINKLSWGEVHLKNGDKAFMCFDCLMVSGSEDDLNHKYCGFCHEFKNK